MASNVFANANAISCKSGNGKVIAAFPDVCLSPPSPPAGPLPIPYPLFSFATDTTAGSKSVKISGKEVMLKDKSYFKKCTGDEPATKTLGQGTLTHTITGKVYFISWSMNVLIEEENVVRHLDRTTSNHASPMANDSVAMVEVEAMSPAPPVDCEQVLAKYPVQSYNEQRKECTEGGMYEGSQSHHVIQNAHFQQPRGTTVKEICPGYTEGGAPCIPLDDGTDPNTAHGRVSQMQNADGKRYRDRGTNPTYQEARADAKRQLSAKPEPGLTEDETECILVEVDKYFKKVCGGKENPELRTPRETWEPNDGVSGGGVGGID